MTAPTTSVRTAQTGAKLRDGFSTKISFNANTAVNIWEKDVQPPGLDGGDPIDQTTMYNIAYRTYEARSLISLTPVKSKACYDPNCYASGQIFSLINQRGSVTIHFPDGHTLDFYGYLKSFTPSAHVEGTAPEADIEIVVTNWDPVANVEQGPVMTSSAGT